MDEAPVWIQTAAELAALAGELVGAETIALDTEADSLHHYPERLCLVQLADPTGRVFLLDTLALPDLEPLRELCARPTTVKVLHSAENDLVHFKRRFGFEISAIFDTMLAARFLGLRELGLDALLERYLGVKVAKGQQRTNWARRPLTPAQEAYAAEDVRHLIRLRGRLENEVRAVGRAAWLSEECAALAAMPVVERPPDENGHRRLPGASRLDPRSLVVLQHLAEQRETWARAQHRPPFKVLNPETLVTLAQLRPRSRDGLSGIAGLTPRLLERYSEGLLSAIERGLRAPIPERSRSPRPRPPADLPAVRARIAALKGWRATAAEATGLEPGVLLPQRLIDILALAPPPDVRSLAAAPGIRRWRAETFGPGILTALAQTP